MAFDMIVPPPPAVPRFSRPDSLGWGIATSGGLTVAAAGLYALVAVGVTRDVEVMAVAIGVAAGIGMALCTRKRHVHGAIAVMIAALGFVLAVLMTRAGIASRATGGAFVTEFLERMRGPLGPIRAYFGENGLRYVLLLAALVPAYLVGWAGDDVLAPRPTSPAPARSDVP